jgi:choline dehydrogenase-like flavoprotein
LVWKVVLQDLIQAEGLRLADAQSFPTSRLFNNV